MFKVAFVAISGLFLLLGCQTTEKVYDPKYVKLSEKNASDLLPENNDESQEDNKSNRSKTACVTEKNVSFVPSSGTKMTTNEISSLLSDNTILSADKDGVFAIFYHDVNKTVGWMPKKTSLGKPDWSTGTVSFENDQYCRIWETWGRGERKCWDVHKGAKRIDKNSFYFVLNSCVAGDEHVVFDGNAFGVNYKGKSDKTTGNLKQNEENTAYLIKKYFGNYNKK